VIGATVAVFVSVCGAAEAEEVAIPGTRQMAATVKRPALSRLKKLFIVVLIYVNGFLGA
jgi:hypothetical protein